jgi:hypothetical protein
MGTSSIDRKIYVQPKQAARRSRSKKGSIEQRTDSLVAPDFLRHKFFPLCVPQGEELYNQEKTEQQYFESLEKVKAFYDMPPLDVSAQPYPCNILLSHWDAARRINKANPYRKLSIVKDDENILLAAQESVEMGYSLYHIPVKPLYLLGRSKDKRDKKVYALLLSVYAYLYRKALVPYYRMEGSFLHDEYECMEMWFTDCQMDMEEEEFEVQRSVFSAAAIYGDIMGNKITHAYQLEKFAERIAAFRPANKWERNCLDIAQSFYRLSVKYPDHNIYTHVYANEEEDDYWEVLHIEQGIGFVATVDDWLGNILIRNISGTLENCAVTEEPTVSLEFDKFWNGKDDHLQYERKLYDLIWNLCDLLKQIS